MYKKMTERARELGAEIFLETPVEGLMMENGTVTGVYAREKDGTKIEEYTGLKVGEDFYPIRVPGLKGEGLKMCWEAGAAKEGVSVELIYHLPDNMTWFSLDAVMRQPCSEDGPLVDGFYPEK